MGVPPAKLHEKRRKPQEIPLCSGWFFDPVLIRNAYNVRWPFVLAQVQADRATASGGAMARAPDYWEETAPNEGGSNSKANTTF
jgi:hypothetical protein